MKLLDELIKLRTRLSCILGYKKEIIFPFDNDFNNALKGTIISGLPVYFHIKYLRPPVTSPTKCYDYSLYMFLCFDDALLVRGRLKYLEALNGRNDEEDSKHGWIEKDGYVYDPVYLVKVKQEDYYRIYGVFDEQKYTLEDYIATEEGAKLYDKVKGTTVDKLRKSGPLRFELNALIPIVQEIAYESRDKEFIEELNDYLDEINYNYDVITNQINKAIIESDIKHIRD